MQRMLKFMVEALLLMMYIVMLMTRLALWMCNQVSFQFLIPRLKTKA